VWRHHRSWKGHAPPQFSNFSVFTVIFSVFTVFTSNAFTPALTPHLQIRGAALGGVMEVSGVVQTKLITKNLRSD